MALVWPSKVPARLNRADATFPVTDARRRFEPSDGPGRIRKRMSAALRPISGSIDMTFTQAVWLQKFWDVDTHGGILPFWFPDPLMHGFFLVGDASEAAIVNARGFGLALDRWILCQFGQEPPERLPLGAQWVRIKISIVALP